MSSSAAHAGYPPTPYIKKLAKQMKCKYGTSDALATDAKVTHAWNCVVAPGTASRREYYLMTYKNTARALDEWRDYLSCTTYDWDEEPCTPGYFARRGDVLIIDQAPGDSYTKQFASYAAGKTGGRVVAGYRFQD